MSGRTPVIVFGAWFALAIAPAVAQAAAPARLTYETSVHCQAAFEASMVDENTIAKTLKQAIDQKQIELETALRDLAQAHGRLLGQARGKTEEQIYVDFTEATDDMIEDFVGSLQDEELACLDKLKQAK